MKRLYLFLLLIPLFSFPALSQTVCPTFSNPNGITICPTDLLTTPFSPSVEVSSADIDIAFTYPVAFQTTAPYSLGLLGVGTPSGSPLTAISSPSLSTYLAPGTYYVYAILYAGDPDYTNPSCQPYAEIVIHVNPALTPPVITGPSQYCNGTGNVTLDAGSGFTSYLWSPGGETSQTISSGPGTYSVSVVDLNGCTGTSSNFTVEDSTINFVFDLVNFTQDESCPGAADGIVRVLTQDILSPSRIFDFSIDNGATWLSESGQAKVFINLTAGNYTAIVRSRYTPSCLSLPKPYTVVTANTTSTAITAIAASASTICPGGTSTLTAAGGVDGTGAQIVWYRGPMERVLNWVLDLA